MLVKVNCVLLAIRLQRVPVSVWSLALSVLKWFWKRVSQIRQSNGCFRISHICQGTIHEQRDFLQSCGFRCHGLRTSFYFLSACRFMPQRLPRMPRVCVARTPAPAYLVVPQRQLLRFWGRTGHPLHFLFKFITHHHKEDCASRPAGGVSLWGLYIVGWWGSWRGVWRTTSPWFHHMMAHCRIAPKQKKSSDVWDESGAADSNNYWKQVWYMIRYVSIWKQSRLQPRRIYTAWPNRTAAVPVVSAPCPCNRARNSNVHCTLTIKSDDRNSDSMQCIIYIRVLHL